MSKELEYKITNFANLVNKDCMNLMECLKKQDKDNKAILYLGKHFKKVIMPYEEYQKMCNHLEAIDNSNPSEAMECLEEIKSQSPVCHYDDGSKSYVFEKEFDTIKQALIKAEKEHNSVNLLMQELDCKDFADLRKYARCGYQRLNNFKGSKEVKIEIPDSCLMDYNPVKQYLKWEDLEFIEEDKEIFALLNGTKYKLKCYKSGNEDTSIMIVLNGIVVADLCSIFYKADKQFFNDLRLERVEE